MQTMRQESVDGCTVKTTKQHKWVIKKWRIEQFLGEEVRQKYEEASSVKVEGFQERVHQWKTQGLRGFELVKAVVQDWEDTMYMYSKESSKRN